MDLDHIADQLDGYSGADITNVCRSVRFSGISVSPITKDLFEDLSDLKELIIKLFINSENHIIWFKI